MLDILKTQQDLIALALPSGFEAPQAALLAELARPFVDDVTIDTLGNVIAHKKGPGKRLMMPGHMDVIGFIAIYIDDNGFIRFERIGGFTPAHLIDTPVRFENGVKGCIRASEKIAIDKPAGEAQLLDLYIDIGAADKASAEKLVKPGDVAVYDLPADPMAGGNVMSPYCDDLMACIVLLIAMEELQGKQSPNDLFFVFSTQEERGLLGAKSSAYHIQPDMGIAVDLTRTGDTPTDTVPMEVSLGKGPTITIKDSSHICNPQVVRHLRAAAEGAGIVYQDEILLAGGTDAAAIQKNRGGVPAGVISIPGRNIHSPAEMVNLSDVGNAGKLMAAAAMLAI
jgi:endoglucanase